MTDPENLWLQKARQGDQQAFTYLVETYQKPVYNLCYRMLGEPGEAEDAAQETFWRAYQALGKYDPGRSFATWLLSIAAHYCIDQQRKRRYPSISMDLIPEDLAPASTAPGPEKVVAQNQQDRILQDLIKTLPPQDRAAMVMRYWYEMSDEEIARSLSLTISAVKSRLHRSRKVLAARYDEIARRSSTALRRQNESPAF